MCSHSPRCPAADSAGRTLAVVIADYREQLRGKAPGFAASHWSFERPHTVTDQR
jgi:hypothetical protein